jgi:hypothetical protein
LKNSAPWTWFTVGPQAVIDNSVFRDMRLRSPLRATVSCFAYFSALNMEAKSFSEAAVDFTGLSATISQKIRPAKYLLETVSSSNEHKMS